MAVAAAVRGRDTPARGICGSRIAISRPSSSRAMRHRQACSGKHGGEAAGSHHARDLDQFIGVIGPAGAGGEHQVVARAFALGARMARGDPRQRVEPVQRARDLRQHVRQAVAPLHVRELVQQHDPQPLGRPACRRRPASARPAGRCPTPSASPPSRCAGRRCAARRRAPRRARVPVRATARRSRARCGATSTAPRRCRRRGAPAISRHRPSTRVSRPLTRKRPASAPCAGARRGRGVSELRDSARTLARRLRVRAARLRLRSVAGAGRWSRELAAGRC